MDAVDFIDLYLGSPSNQKAVSFFIELEESEPWSAFLVPSVPKYALNDSGASFFAAREFVGPMAALHLSTAFSATNSIPITTSEVMNV